HGDTARKDSEGYWYLLGREDDIINKHGRKISPAEIEQALLATGISDAAVKGSGDGETRIEAYVKAPRTGKKESTRQKLEQEVSQRMGRPFVPDEFVFVGEIPRNEAGKPLRDRLSPTLDGGS
ncbi:MAG: acetyl-CoA synthetase, partial [Candidatus Nanohaloarchaea archaeon]